MKKLGGSEAENGKQGRKVWVRYAVFAAVLIAMIFWVYRTVGGTKVVGKSINGKDIQEFYYTKSTSANPPLFQRYRLTARDGKYYFYHEKREGDHWPLTEADITASGSKELTEEQWSVFYECLKGGTVKKRVDSAASGGRSPSLVLYWKGDQGTIREFLFESVEKRLAFEELCGKQKESAV